MGVGGQVGEGILGGCGHHAIHMSKIFPNMHKSFQNMSNIFVTYV